MSKEKLMKNFEEYCINFKKRSEEYLRTKKEIESLEIKIVNLKKLIQARDRVNMIWQQSEIEELMPYFKKEVYYLISQAISLTDHPFEETNFEELLADYEDKENELEKNLKILDLGREQSKMMGVKSLVFLKEECQEIEITKYSKEQELMLCYYFEEGFSNSLKLSPESKLSEEFWTNYEKQDSAEIKRLAKKLEQG